MSKLDQIVAFLETEKTDVAVVSDPVTINYLTGFYSDPHERQLFLFVYPDHEPLLFVPALEVERATAVVDFQVVGYVDSENPWEKIKGASANPEAKTVALEFDNLILTKYHGLRSVFEQATFTNLSPRINRMRLIKSADEIQKMLVAGQYADKAVNMGFDAISLDKTETDIVAEIDFGIKRLGYEMSFETMVLTGNNAANPHGIPGSNKIEKDALLLFDLGCMVNGYASDMTSDTVSEWMCMNSLLSWKEMTWSSKKACASQSNQASTSLEKSEFGLKTVAMSQKMALASLPKPAKTCSILIKLETKEIVV